MVLPPSADRLKATSDGHSRIREGITDLLSNIEDPGINWNPFLAMEMGLIMK